MVDPAFLKEFAELAQEENKKFRRGTIAEIARGASQAIRLGLAEPFQVLQRIVDETANYMESKGQKVNRHTLFGDIASSITPDDLSDEATLATKIGRIVGGLAVAIPKYALAMRVTGATTPLGMAGVGAGVDALTAWGHKLPPAEIAKEAGKGAVLFGGMGLAQKMLPRWPRAGAVAAGTAGLEAVTGTTEPEDIALSGLTMGLLSLPGRLPKRMVDKLHALGYPDEVIKHTNIKELRRIIKEGTEFIPRPSEPPPVFADISPAQTPTTTTDWQDLVKLLQEAKTQDLVSKGIPISQPYRSWQDLAELIRRGREEAQGITQPPSPPTRWEELRELIRKGREEAEKSRIAKEQRITTEGIPTQEVPAVGQPTHALEGSKVKPTIPEPPKGEAPSTPKEITIQDINSLLNYVYEQILLSKGFELRAIASMPAQTKAAIASSPYTSKDLKVNYITGALSWKKGAKRRDYPPPGLGIPRVEDLISRPVNIVEGAKVVGEAAKSGELGETIVVNVPKAKEPLPKVVVEPSVTPDVVKGATLPIKPGDKVIYRGEEVTVDKVARKTVRVLKPDGTKVVVEIDKLGQPETKGRPVIKYNKDIYNYLKTILDITDSDAKMSSVVLEKAGITTPEAIRARLDAIPDLHERALRDRRIGGVLVKGQKLYDLLTKQEELLDASEAQFAREVKRKLNEQKFQKELNTISEKIKATETKIVNSMVRLTDITNRLKNVRGRDERATLTRAELRARRDNIKKGLQTLNATLKELKAKKQNLEAEWESFRKVRERIADTGIEPEITIKGALKTSRTSKTKKILEDIEAEKARIAAEEKALSETPGAGLDEAAESMGLSRDKLDAVPVDVKDKITKAISQLDEASAKAGEDVEAIQSKHISEINKAARKAISTDPTTDPELVMLQNKAKALQKRLSQIEKSATTTGDYPPEYTNLNGQYFDLLKQISERRKAINKKRESSAREGLEQIGYTVSKEDSGVVIVRKKVDDTTDSFHLITTDEGRIPIPGDTNIREVGRMVVKTEQGVPVIRDMTDVQLPNSDFFKANLEDQVANYYAKQGKPLKKPKPDGSVTLGMGVDPTMVANTIRKLKDITVQTYQAFKERREKHKGAVYKDEIPDVMKHIIEIDKRRFSKEQLQDLLKLQDALNAQERMRREKIPPSPEKPDTTPASPDVVASNIQKHIAEQMPLIDRFFGQSIASKNPDVVKVAELAIIRDLRIKYSNDALVHGQDAVIRNIFKRIDETQPGYRAYDLRRAIGALLIAETTGNKDKAIGAYARTFKISPEQARERLDNLAKDPLVIEAIEKIKTFLDESAKTYPTLARHRDLWVSPYFPLIADMHNTYRKVRALFERIETPEQLPKRYWEGDKPALSMNDLLEIKSIFQKYQNWNDLPEIAKNRIRYDVLQFEGIYDNFAFLPPDLQEALNAQRKSFNRHLQPRKGGELLEYELDADQVLRMYTYTMVRAEADNMFLDEVRPILNKYASTGSGGSITDVRYYLESQVKQALGRPTLAERTARAIANDLNNRMGKAVLDPNWLTSIATRVTTQVARGALGPDSAMRNILDITRSMVTQGGFTTLRAIQKQISHLAHTVTHGRVGKEIDPQTFKFYQMLLGDLFQDIDLPPRYQLRGRLVSAHTPLEKVTAVYDWLSDIAMTPLRATEHFVRFTTFLAALENAAKRGDSFTNGVRIGLLNNTTILPDLLIPTAWWNAAQDVLRTQYGYRAYLRNPALRGPLARMSTIFWSYGFNTAQFILNGLHRAWGQGDYAMLTRYMLYLGMQLSIASAALWLGLDLTNVFGVGILPIKFLSLPWDMLKSAYHAVAGKRAEDRSRGWDDFLDSLAILTIPQGRYIQKVVREAQAWTEGYYRGGAWELMAIEHSPFMTIMNLAGFPLSHKKEVYDLVASIHDEAFEYRKEKRDLVRKGLKAMREGNLGELQKIYAEAAKKNINLTAQEMKDYFHWHQQLTYLDKQLQRLPKHKRPIFEAEVKRLKERYLPTATIERQLPMPATKSMWSSRQHEAEEED